VNDEVEAGRGTMVFQKMFNSLLDAFVAPEVHILHRSPSAFHVCGCVGVAVALLTVSLVTHMALSPWVVVGLILVAVWTSPVVSKS
jgi:hypothetical protein